MKTIRTKLLLSGLLKVGIAIVFTISINGCGISYLASRDTNPVIQDNARMSFFSDRQTVVFATTASRRLAIIAEDRSEVDQQGKSIHNIITCA